MNALDISKYFIEKARTSKSENGNLHDLTPLKLQKILYYAQGWYLANKHKPLFKEKVWAWKYGPVVREVYDTFHEYSQKNLATAEPKIDTTHEIDPEVKEFLDTIWHDYGVETADELVDMTHNSNPWLDAISNPYSDEITPQAMQKYFAALL